MQPLASRMRPTDLNDFVGQAHIMGPNGMLRNIIESNEIRNMIFYGPSGTGKTTLAKIIADRSSMNFQQLNATNASTSDIKNIRKLADTEPVLLYLDEIQAFNKKQQQSLLEIIEDGRVTLIAATTENPMFYVYNAILSRCVAFEFKPLEFNEIMEIAGKGFMTMAREQKVRLNVSDEAMTYLCHSSGGDVRKALTSVEACMLGTQPDDSNAKNIDLTTVKNTLQNTNVTYDKNGDKHYDLISAFQKSMRGSDPNAALYYLARLIKAGDLPIICRRLIVCACEDVGLAYPNIIPIVKACVDTAMFVGFPEASLPLADAVILVSLAPKSNAGHDAINAALEHIGQYGEFPVPRNLQNKHFDGAEVENPGQFYVYPHSYPNHWTYQQYLPDAIKAVQFYVPGENLTEQSYQEYWRRIKENVLENAPGSPEKALEDAEQ